MANRDGVKLYDWNKLTDRRSGYGWYTTKPAATLADVRDVVYSRIRGRDDPESPRLPPHAGAGAIAASPFGALACRAGGARRIRAIAGARLGPRAGDPRAHRSAAVPVARLRDHAIRRASATAR